MSVWQATLTLNPYNILASTCILLVLIKRQSECVCEREIESVCVCVRERVCVCVCERNRE